MSATATIADLERSFTNQDIIWEAVVAAQYRGGGSYRNVVDIGAHKGIHAGPLADQSEHVFAFEPIPKMAAALREKFAETANITISECALSTMDGETTFHWNVNSAEESGLIPRLYASDTSNIVRLNVAVKRLDGFGIKDLDYIKSDCEGADLLALQGGLESIKAGRPTISIEYGLAGYSVFGFSQTSIFDFADSIGYGVFDLFGQPIQRSEAGQCMDRFYWDFILIPLEGADKIKRAAETGAEILAAIWSGSLQFVQPSAAEALAKAS